MEVKESESRCIVVVGNSGVGKTTFLQQVTSRGSAREARVATRHRATTTMEVYPITLALNKRDGGQRRLFTFVDSPGADRFGQLLPSFMRRAGAVILVCSLDYQVSCDALEEWWESITCLVHEGTPVLVVANKADLLLEAAATASLEGVHVVEARSVVNIRQQQVVVAASSSSCC
jgi:small GTP-binding protein